jgi:GNAT superfamily N-acetyltransferase
MEVRPARADELAAVMTVLANGYLAVDAATVEAAIGAGRCLVCADEGRVLGALVLDDDLPTEGARIEAVAVGRSRRGQGIGTALVEAAAAGYERLVCEFDAGVRPFWEALGFEVAPHTVPGRFVGWLDERAADG